jgi:hypothetical protein
MVRLPFTNPNKTRHFLQSIFPATEAGKIMGRPVRGEFNGPDRVARSASD